MLPETETIPKFRDKSIIIVFFICVSVFEDKRTIKVPIHFKSHFEKGLEMSSIPIEDKFNAAVNVIKNLPKNGKFSQPKVGSSKNFHSLQL